ncbi:MAG: hypothetical protein KF692_01915 [Cryobacterium sp.]|nr:hypothetical protein [Cryobacterium sp.]
MIRQDPVVAVVGGIESTFGIDSVIEDWSYFQPISLRVVLQVPIEQAISSLHLADDAELSTLLKWAGKSTSIRGASSPIIVTEEEITLEAEVPAGSVRRGLDVSVLIVVNKDGSGRRDPLAPHGRGTVVWESTASIDLEGIAPRMPVAGVAFTDDHMASAMWWLQVAAADELDLDAPTESAIWMWVNSENDKARALLDDPSNEISLQYAQFLKLDLNRQLVRLMLDADDFDPEEQYPSGSLGQLFQTQLLALDRPLDDLRRLSPTVLDAQIQHAFVDEVTR